MMGTMVPLEHAPDACFIGQVYNLHRNVNKTLHIDTSLIQVGTEFLSTGRFLGSLVLDSQA